MTPARLGIGAVDIVVSLDPRLARPGAGTLELLILEISTKLLGDRR